MCIDWKNQYFQIAVLSKLIYRFSTVLIKTPKVFFRNRQVDAKINILKCKESGQNTFEEVAGLALPVF